MMTNSLSKSRTETSAALTDRIELGRAISEALIVSNDELESMEQKHSDWHEYNVDLLGRAFSDNRIANEYADIESMKFISRGMSLNQKIDSRRQGLRDQIAKLVSIQGRLELFPESIHPQETDQLHLASSDVFIVHGHDEAAREAVARFVEKLDLVAVVLHERTNSGRTVIEKFESNACNSAFAIVLMTPDDIGGPIDSDSQQCQRARQNVILELGYFIGKLGRSRVCVLKKGELETPSDILGIVYTTMDEKGAWKIELARELKAAGFNVDVNRLL